MLKRLAIGLAVAGLAVVLVSLAIPLSGTPRGSSTDLSCGPALGAALGTGGGEVVMTGPDTGITERAWCEKEAGDLLRPALAFAAALVVAGIAVYAAERAGRVTEAVSSVP